MPISVKNHTDIVLFLAESGYEVEERGDDVYIIRHQVAVAADGGDDSGLTSTIVAVSSDGEISFALDLLHVDSIPAAKRESFYAQMLDLNTEINPIAFALNTVEASDKRVVLVDSISTEDLDSSELLHTLDNFESAAIKAWEILREYVVEDAA